MPVAVWRVWLGILSLGAILGASAPAQELKPRAHDGNLGSGFKSEHAEVNGVRLHYVSGGQGLQTIVLLPGWPQTWYTWRNFMPELAKTHRVIAVEIRGMGESTRPDSGYDTRTAASDIAGLMGKLGVGRYSVIGSTTATVLGSTALPLIPSMLSMADGKIRPWPTLRPPCASVRT